jgi:hypothetical protein
MGSLSLKISALMRRSRGNFWLICSFCRKFTAFWMQSGVIFLPIGFEFGHGVRFIDVWRESVIAEHTYFGEIDRICKVDLVNENYHKLECRAASALRLRTLHFLSGLDRHQDMVAPVLVAAQVKGAVDRPVQDQIA